MEDYWSREETGFSVHEESTAVIKARDMKPEHISDSNNVGGINN